ncbi:MAG: WbqC family protein [Cytophagales bacterium]|nr:WbqC family protein [Bernardetiaceae bacterium]MDW8210608.1 WbqC family protein [Cytophagales bacterium]
MQPEAVIDLHYFPSVETFIHLLDKEKVLAEFYCHYEKKTCKNRCYILGPHQVQRLTVPVLKTEGKTPYCQVRIDYHQPWQNHHWRSIRTAYGKAPYFEHYADTIQKLIYSREEYLAQLNFKILTICLEILQLPVKVNPTTEYRKNYLPPLQDLRDKISCAPVYNAPQEGYAQLFGKSFVHNLSVIDMLFCQGAQAVLFLRKNALPPTKQLL